MRKQILVLHFSCRFLLTASLRRLKMPMYISLFTDPLVQQILYTCIIPAIQGIFIHYYVYKCTTIPLLSTYLLSVTTGAFILSLDELHYSLFLLLLSSIVLHTTFSNSRSPLNLWSPRFCPIAGNMTINGQQISLNFRHRNFLLNFSTPCI